MIELTPEILMAYVDDELDARQRLEVEAALETDAEARELVAQFRRSAEILGTGLNGVLDQPVPQRLVDAARGKSGRVVALQHRRPWIEKAGLPGLAAAASVLLVVGIAVGRLWVDESAGGMTMAAADPLQRALEQGESGSTWHDDGLGTSVTPMLTFRSADGRPCREFERQGDGLEVFGVACRNKEGRWIAQIEVQQKLLTDASPNGAYLPASGGTDPVSDVLDALGAGPALTVEEEKRLLEAGWD